MSIVYLVFLVIAIAFAALISALALALGLALAVLVLLPILRRGRAWALVLADRLALLIRIRFSDSADDDRFAFGLLVLLTVGPALALVRLLTFSFGNARMTSAQGQRRARRVPSSAAGLLATAARLLPAADADRYAEEYLSELWELAESGAGRLRQLLYAVRQLLRALPMRFMLRSPRRRSTTP